MSKYEKIEVVATINSMGGDVEIHGYRDEDSQQYDEITSFKQLTAEERIIFSSLFAQFLCDLHGNENSINKEIELLS